MQLGSQNRNQIIILAVLLVIAAFFLPGMFSHNTGTQAQSATTSTSTAAVKKPAMEGDRRQKWPPPRKGQAEASLDPALRFDLLKLGEDQVYEGGKRNIFSAEPTVVIPPVVDPGKVIVDHSHDAPPPLPPPPPIPLKFYGFATQTGQAKRVFLSSTTGDDVFVGIEGQVINRRYRIVKVNNSSVEVEDILNNNKQTLPLVSPQT